MFASSGFQSYRPTAYLDQWVWIRLARAATGKADDPRDSDLLEALIEAADAGVAFPLSSTHYIETQSIPSARQRHDVAGVMSVISHCRTFRRRRDLLRNQLLIAMHEEFGRPTFRPNRLDPLGLGVHWAFEGIEKTLQVHDADGQVIDSPELPRELRIRATQGVEFQLLAGPLDDQVTLLREQYGYKPEATTEAGRSRLEWEQDFVRLLVESPPSDPVELRVWIQAREVLHENLELLSDVFREYGLPMRRLSGGFDDDPRRSREFISGFFDRLPSLQVATDLKLAVHRNNQRGWALNDVYDIDAMSIAVPYCAVVVADKAVTDALHRLKTGDRQGTLVTGRLEELNDVLPEMVEHASTLPDASGWESLSPGVGFRPLNPEQVAEEMRRRLG